MSPILISILRLLASESLRQWLLMQTTHKGVPVVPQLTKCLENNHWIIFLIIKLKLYIYSLEFFHIVHTCACKNISEVLNVPGWTPEVYSSVCKCNVADTMSPFYHLLWALHQFAPGWGLHIEESPKGIVLEVPIVSMSLNFICRTFIYMTTYPFPFWHLTAPNISWISFSLGGHWPTPCHMVTLPISMLCLRANPSFLWVSVCFCERCSNIYFI